ncbi:MAG: glycosyltransferase family 4 protein [Candidatus Sumerlaeaceae bacterium]|nr:glycosyltransferase family 4 protein [Candidatus Sumerlaeaceae bacterium]
MMRSDCNGPTGGRASEPLLGSRLFFIANATEPDAPTRLLLDILRQAKQSGADCSFFAWSRAGGLEEYAMSLLGHRPVVLRKDGAMGDVGAILKLRAHVKSQKPHLVHVILTRPGIWVPPVVKMSGYARVVITQHGVHEWSEGNFPECLVRRAFCIGAAFADTIVTVSRAVARDVVRANPSLAGKICTIYNGVDTDRFRPNCAEYREQLIAKLFPETNPQRVFLVGAAGNLRPIKGYDVLLQAAVLLRHLSNFRFIVWGEGSERDRLEKAIESYGLKKYFVLGGFVNNLPECLASCDCFVQPSRYESFGLAAAEAMACGLPVIASNVGGLPELIDDGRTGFLVSPEQPHAIASHIRFLAENADLRQEMGKLAATRVRQYFTVERMVGEYLQLYSRLLQESQSCQHLTYAL